MRYVVQPWETWESMDSLASRFGVTADALVAANPILRTIPLDPGMILTIPGKPTPTLPPNGYMEYVIQPGDSFFQIANKYRLNYRNLVAQNPQITNPDVLWPGEIIYLIYA